jgi:hypothetical protein
LPLKITIFQRKISAITKMVQSLLYYLITLPVSGMSPAKLAIKSTCNGISLAKTKATFQIFEAVTWV